MSKHSSEECADEDMLEKTGVMFAATILFLQTVWEYCRVVNRLDLVCKYITKQNAGFIQSLEKFVKV